MVKRYFHHAGRETFGPFSANELKRRATIGEIDPDDWISVDDGKRDLARNVQGLFVDSRAATDPAKRRASTSPPGSENLLQFQSPVSTLLNVLTIEVVNCMNLLSRRGELSETDFQQRATGLLKALEGAVVACEAEATPGTVSRSPQSRRQRGGQSLSQLGLAAMIGGAWGYLLGDRSAHGSPALVSQPDDENPYAMLTPGVAADPDEVDLAPFVVADIDHDGKADLVVADTDGDGQSDLIGRDIDEDGDLDEIFVDTDGDGDIDRYALIEDVDAGDEALESVEFDSEADFEDDLMDTFDAGDFDGGGFDFGGFDFDFG